LTLFESKRIFGIDITKRLFSITAFIAEKSILSGKIILRLKFPQKHSLFLICIFGSKNSWGFERTPEIVRVVS